MAFDHTFMLERSLARDQAYDGRFLMGVTSTGIYCLPSCPARKPREDHVRFFEDESQARRAGLRPCRRCRPDHFYRGFDPDRERLFLLEAAVRNEPWRFPGVAAMAGAAKFGMTKLSALFREIHHVTPLVWLTKSRIDHAMSQLLGTKARVVDVGASAGFESLSAFQENFRRLTGMTPVAYRALGQRQGFHVELPEGYRLHEALAYLARDPKSPTEHFDGKEFTRVLDLGGAVVTLRLAAASQGIRCRLESGAGLSKDQWALGHATLVRLLGLHAHPEPFERRLHRRPELKPLVAGHPGLRIPLTADPFEGLLWAIVGQQVNLTFAYTLRRRLIELSGTPLDRERRAHPTPMQVAALDIQDLIRCQFSRRKAEYVLGAAREVLSGTLPLNPSLPFQDLERRLLAVRGIGPWSAHYALMRGLGFGDCVPVGDAGLVAALKAFFKLPERPDASRTHELMAPFSPYRSLATFHFWRYLGETT